MKFNYFTKVSPFLSTLLIIICLSLSNQKESTNLRILIWETPSLTLGTYLAISTGTGFILSYLITTNTAKLYQAKQMKNLKFKEKRIDESSNEISEPSTNISYDNTLIERDIKDPSPTINASFRIIGKKERSNINFVSDNNKVQYDDSFDFEEQFNEQTDQHTTIDQVSPISNDWNDESYSTW
ncbi:hypothetical protein [Prochlorococcus marinus]|uniref:hypothetical protein n=1 Tax=Prochlorococcus marinus TaxID=1219 RepID=UPI0022B2C706|nr:hypothetical protein [Prochlorococcus marinus]